MMGVSKGMRSSDSWRKAFIRKVREIGVTVNWSISMLVVRVGGEWPPLRERCQREASFARKIDFSYFPVVGTRTVCPFEGL